QNALNRIWEVHSDTESSMILDYIRKRALSFAMLLAIAVLLLASLILSTTLIRFAGSVGEAIGLPTVFTSTVGLLLNLALTTALFATVFAVLPDAQIAWKNVWFGALMTTLLFVAGNYGVTLYFNLSSAGNPFGATGSLALLLLWVFFNAAMILAGAEFTCSWSRRGGPMGPAESGD
ncbi:MAG: YihY/virulence factor BrkB family protein, partial [Phycisphaerae bacterium]